MIRAIGFASTLLFTVALIAQEAAPPAGPSEARKLFDRAAAQQDPDGRSGSITSLCIAADFKMHDRDAKGAETRLVGRIRQFWARRTAAGKAASAYRREVESDLGERHAKVLTFDGAGWANLKDGPFQPMSGAAYERDLSQLRAEKARMELLLHVLLLRELRFDEDRLLLRPGSETIDFVIGSARQGQHHHVTRVLEIVDREGRRLTLWIDEKSLDLVQARIVPADDPDHVEEFRLARPKEAVFGDKTGKLRVPREILYLENDRPVLEIQCGDSELRLNELGAADLIKLFEFEQ